MISLSLFYSYLYIHIIIVAILVLFKFPDPPPAPTFLQPTFIAENATDGIKVYRFNWELPANIENVDINHFKFQLDNEMSITLVRTRTEIVLPLSYGEYNVSIVIVDRCNHGSEANTLQLEVKKGECIAQSKHQV